MQRQPFNKNWTCNGEAVTLPHDAMLSAGRDPQAPGGSANGFFQGGHYRYEKAFDAPESWRDKRVMLQFEGVYRNARVLCNDVEVGGCVYGYLPFFADLADALRYGESNSLVVEADTSEQPAERWYTGGGIYRPVWLWIGEQDGFEPEALQVSTASVNPPRIRVHVEYAGAEAPIIRVLDGDTVLAQASGTDANIDLPGARLWSEHDPALYTCTAELPNGECTSTRFGIRTIDCNPKGLFVNGEPTLLRGGCVHHDNGILGAATHTEAEYRRVRKLKEAGFNAIRSAHNPASPALMDVCDELGVYLIDEGWDMWFNHKSRHDYASDWEERHLDDLSALVSRDFNHPSVIMYSIGNEVSEPASERGLEAERAMVDHLHALDPTRLVTGGFNLMIISSAKKGKGVYDDEAGGRKNNDDDRMKGMNSTLFNLVTNVVGTGMNKAANSRAADIATAPALDMLDICGYNYASGRYRMEGKAHPQRVIYGSETFPQDIAKNWQAVESLPYLVGDFMWTAWDYLGEAGLGAWAYTPDGKGFNKPYPWLLADCGAFDIIGTPGAPVALAQAAWHLDTQPWIGVQPLGQGAKPAKAVWRGSNAIASWSWHGCEGERAIIEVYSSAAAVELFLNGRRVGRKKPKLCKACFKAAYQPGTLLAVAYDSAGREIGRNDLSSAENNLYLQAHVQREGDLRYVEIDIADASGTVESHADEAITLAVEQGELLGFGSANPRTEEDYLTGKFTTYRGRALAIVKPSAGSFRLRASGATLGEIVVEDALNKNANK